MSCRCCDFSQTATEVGGFNAMTRRMNLLSRQKFMLYTAKWMKRREFTWEKIRHCSFFFFFRVRMVHFIISRLCWLVLSFSPELFFFVLFLSLISARDHRFLIICRWSSSLELVRQLALDVTFFFFFFLVPNKFGECKNGINVAGLISFG